MKYDTDAVFTWSCDRRIRIKHYKHYITLFTDDTLKSKRNEF